MSSENPSRYSWRSAAIAMVISTVGVLIVYFAFGRQWEDAAAQLIAQEKAQRELNTDLDRVKEIQKQTQKEIDEIEAKVSGQSHVAEQTRQKLADVKSRATIQQEQARAVTDKIAADQTKAARHRSQTVMLLHRGRQTEQQLTSLKVAAASWAELYQELLISDSGRRIASSDQHVELIAAIGSRQHVTTADVDSLRREFDALYEPVLQAESDARNVIVADNGFEEVIQQLEKRIRDAADVIRKDTLLVNAIEQETAHREKGKATLQDALAKRELNSVKQQANDLSIARAEAELEAAQRLEEAEAANIAAQTEVEEAELARQAAERRAVAAGILDEKKKLDQQAALAEQRRKLELEYARELPEIRRLLHPFITPGIFQPSRNGFDGRYRPESMSLTAIASTGALQKTDKGLAELYRVGGSEFTAMRGLGSFPAHNNQNFKRDASVRARVERAQELLLKYGDLLVEKGILLD